MAFKDDFPVGQAITIDDGNGVLNGTVEKHFPYGKVNVRMSDGPDAGNLRRYRFKAGAWHRIDRIAVTVAKV